MEAIASQIGDFAHNATIPFSTKPGARLSFAHKAAALGGHIDMTPMIGCSGQVTFGDMFRRTTGVTAGVWRRKRRG